jgi:hypothetical protein
VARSPDRATPATASERSADLLLKVCGFCRSAHLKEKPQTLRSRSALQAHKFLFFWQEIFSSMHGGIVNSGCGHIDILDERFVSTCLVAAPLRWATLARKQTFRAAA